MAIANPVCRQIPLRDISSSRRWNLHPWSADTLSSDLSSSLSRSGIVHPPYLLCLGDHSYEILTGSRRCCFAAKAKQETVLCLVLPAETNIRCLLDLILADQLLYRPLSLVEKARFLEICARHLDNAEIVNSYLERLQLSKRKRTLDNLAELLLQNPEIIEAIDQGYVQEKMASDLLLLVTPDDRLALIRLFRQLHIGDNQQKRLFSALLDLCRRHQTQLSNYLRLPEVTEILDHPRLNQPQKVQHLGRFLQQQLTPELMQAGQDFRDRLKDLQLPPRCVLQHSQAFETDTVDLTVTFQDLSAFAALLPAIRKLLGEE